MIKFKRNEEICTVNLGKGTAGLYIVEHNGKCGLTFFNTDKKQIGKPFPAVQENAEPPFVLIRFGNKKCVDVMIETLYKIKDKMAKNG